MQLLRGSGQVYLTCGFSPDGNTFAAGGTGHVVELWNLADPAALTRQLDMNGLAVSFTGYRPNGQLIIARIHGAFDLVPTSGPLDFYTSFHLPLTVFRAGLSIDGTKLITAGDSITLWEVGMEFRELIEIAAGPGEIFTGVALSPDARRFASARILASGESVIEVWDSTGGGFYRLIAVQGIRADKLAWSPDGRLLAGLVDKHLSFWETDNWERILGPDSELEPGQWISAAFHPAGSQLLTGGASGEVACWDVITQNILTTFRWNVGPVYALAFASDGLRAAAAGHGAIILWDFDA